MQNLKDYNKAIRELFEKNYKDEVNRQRYCQFKVDDDRFCLATTQKTCKKCRFFEPTIQSKFRIVVEKTEELKRIIKGHEKTINGLNEELERLDAIIEEKDNRIHDLVEKLADAAQELVDYKEKVNELQSESDNKN